MWKLTKWYEKVVYIIGWIYTVLMLLAFIVGFVEGVLEG